jgi:hypothetical protein
MPERASSTHPVGQVGGDLSLVVGRGDLDLIDPGQGERHGDVADRIEQLAAGETSGLRGARSRCHARIDDVDIDGEEHRITVVRGDGGGLVQNGVEAAAHDFGHLEAAHALLAHPLQRLGFGPIAAQADLEEPVAARCGRLPS